MITVSDYDILRNIIDKNSKTKGVIPTEGTTIKELVEKTSLSDRKIRLTISNFLKDGLIDFGLAIKNSKSYIVTDKGLAEIIKIAGKDKC